jgi:hypothetical protein
MAEIRINTTGGLKLYDADNSHYAQIVAGTITSNVDAITLGHDTVTIADNLSLGSDSAILKFGADTEIALTHVADTGLKLTDSGGTPTLQLHDANESIASDGSKVIITSGGTAFSLPTSDGSSGQVLSTNGSGVLSFATASSADPSSADGDSLGTASAEWSDLYLADGGIIYFGNDQDVTLTHDPDDGLFLKSIATGDDNPVLLTLQTGETDLAANDVIGKISFQAPDEGTGTDAILVSGAIQAVAEGDHSSSSNATRLEFMTGASEAATSQMTISSGGIVGIGAGVPGDLGTGLHIKIADTGASVNSAADELVIEGTSTVGMSFLTNNDQDSNITFGDSDANERGRIQYSHGSDFMAFHTNADEAMRISSGHSFNFNYGNQNNGVVTMYISAQHDQTGLAIRSANTGDRQTVAFTDGQDQACGSIFVNGSGNTVTYNTSSDYRLKENVNYDFDATTELKKLKPAKFNWKTNSSLTIEGFIAHEVSGIVPLAVQGTKDETEVIPNGVYNANGNLQRKDVSEDEWTKGKTNGVFASDTTWSASKTVPVYQQIDHSKLVPLLVKTVQELEARIKTLEG